MIIVIILEIIITIMIIIIITILPTLLRAPAGTAFCRPPQVPKRTTAIGPSATARPPAAMLVVLILICDICI